MRSFSYPNIGKRVVKRKELRSQGFYCTRKVRNYAISLSRGHESVSGIGALIALRSVVLQTLIKALDLL